MSEMLEALAARERVKVVVRVGDLVDLYVAELKLNAFAPIDFGIVLGIIGNIDGMTFVAQIGQ